MTLPRDPALLTSVLNTLLRDEYDSLEVLCEDRDLDLTELRELLRSLGLEYEKNSNRIR